MKKELTKRYPLDNYFSDISRLILLILVYSDFTSLIRIPSSRLDCPLDGRLWLVIIYEIETGPENTAGDLPNPSTAMTLMLTIVIA